MTFSHSTHASIYCHNFFPSQIHVGGSRYLKSTWNSVYDMFLKKFLPGWVIFEANSLRIYYGYVILKRTVQIGQLDLHKVAAFKALCRRSMQLSHKFPNDFGLSRLGNEEILGKVQNWVQA